MQCPYNDNGMPMGTDVLIGIFVFACCGEFLNKAKFVSENLYVQDSVRIFAPDFRANAKAYIDAIINDNGTLFINRGTTAAVLISLEEYNSIKATEKVLETASVSNEIELGIEQLSRGERIVVDIDSL